MTSYAAAPSHYLSPKRRDPVKVLMEEVATHRVLARAVRGLRLPPGAPLRVLDIGAGTGDGLALLRDGHGEPEPASAGHPVRYRGLDLDPAMVRTARELHAGQEGVAFDRGNVLDPEALGGEPYDLYLSCGVPYSHLSAAEARTAVAGLLRHGAAGGRPFAVVVDVLGRYSVEWTPRWGQERWNYAMTFFEDVAEPMVEPMAVYDRASLGALISGAAADAGLAGHAVSYTDRSVAVGRHTATGSFNPELPPYRTRVNALTRGEPVPFAELRFDAPESGAPDEILDFFGDWAKGWNAAVDAARASAGAAAPPPPAARALARTLLDHELDAPRGLGVGHSLTAVVTVGADGEGR